MKDKGKSARTKAVGTGKARGGRQRATEKPAVTGTPTHNPHGTSDLLRIQRDLAFELLSTFASLCMPPWIDPILAASGGSVHLDATTQLQLPLRP